MKQLKFLNKIVCVIVVAAFFLTATAYPYEAQSKTTLRSNISFGKDNKDQSTQRFNKVILMQHFGLSKILPQGQAAESIDNIQKDGIVKVLLGDKKTLVPITGANAIDLVKSKDLIVGLNYKGETVIAVSDPLITPEILGQTEITINGFTLEGAAVTLPKSPVFTLEEIGTFVRNYYDKTMNDKATNTIREMVTNTEKYTPKLLEEKLESNHLESLQALTTIYLRGGMFSEGFSPSKRNFIKTVLATVLLGPTVLSFFNSCSKYSEPTKPEEPEIVDYDFTDNPNLENVYSQAVNWTLTQQIVYDWDKQLIKSFGDFSSSIKASEIHRLFDQGAYVTVFSNSNNIQDNLSKANSVGSALTWHEMTNGTWKNDLASNENTQTAGALVAAGRGWAELAKIWGTDYRNAQFKMEAIKLAKGPSIVNDYDPMYKDLGKVVSDVKGLVTVLGQQGLIDQDGFLLQKDYSNVTLPGFKDKQNEIFTVLRSYQGGLPAYWNESGTDEGYYKVGLKNGQTIDAVSTADNARAGIFLFRLWEEINDLDKQYYNAAIYKHKDGFKNKFIKIANWLKNEMWQGDHFLVGSGNIGELKDEDVEAQAVTVSFFNMINQNGILGADFNPDNFNALSYIESYKKTITLKGKDGKDRTISLYSKTKNGNQVSPPVSLHVASMYKILGNTNEYNNILGEVAKTQYKNGGIPYLLSQDKGEINIGTNYPFPSVEATLDFMAAYKLDPKYFAEAEKKRRDSSNGSLALSGAVIAAEFLQQNL